MLGRGVRRCATATGVQRAIASMTEAADDSSLADRVAHAEQIIIGLVIGVRRATPAGPILVKEPDPEWWIAGVHVRETLKGHQLTEIAVRFAGSHDAPWRNAPKLSAGKQSLLLLHRDAAKRAGGDLVVLDALDVQPVDPAIVDRVRQLLSRPRRS